MQVTNNTYHTSDHDMTKKRLLIVGARSDLISTISTKAVSNGFSLLEVSRKDWDLSDPHPPKTLLDKIIKFSPNHLLYAAGINEINDPIHTESGFIIESIDTHINVNCLSFISLVLSLNQSISEGLTSIHVISSLYGVFGREGRLPYSVSKHALEGAIKCLAIEFSNTLVLGYRPGFFSTKLTNSNLSPESQADLIQRIPSARFGEPSELSDIIFRNIENPPFYMTGSCITIDGGLTAGGVFHT